MKIYPTSKKYQILIASAIGVIISEAILCNNEKVIHNLEPDIPSEQILYQPPTYTSRASTFGTTAVSGDIVAMR